MAPEQLEGRDADARSDLFAFGAMLYEMLTGKRAFPGESRSKVAAAVLDRSLPPIATTQPLTPPALDHLVTTCLAKNPDDRWQTRERCQTAARMDRRECPAADADDARARIRAVERGSSGPQRRRVARGASSPGSRWPGRDGCDRAAACPP